MAKRPRRLTDDGYELDFRDIEYALYGLAKFKKPEDIRLIKEKLHKHVWELSSLSFTLMKEFPDTAFFDVLQTYHKRKFYAFSGNRPNGFTGYYADRAAPEDFIRALVAQQSEKSAKLLDTMLNILPKQTCLPDKKNILEELILEIWDHPCPAFAALKEKIRAKAVEAAKGRVIIYLDPAHIPKDTTTKKITWFN